MIAFLLTQIAKLKSAIATKVDKSQSYTVSLSGVALSYDTPYTCPSDGYLRIIPNASGPIYGMIDGATVYSVDKDDKSYATIFVRKGMVITVSSNVSGQSIFFFGIS